jgi:serine/threonine protein kinase
MGEVVNAHDRRIGRDVAIKRMRAADPSDASIARFLREARIQARLDHPAIVPVHELGIDTDGRPYFSACGSSSRTAKASCIAISSRPTSGSASMARCTCSTGASRVRSATPTTAGDPAPVLP